MPSIASLPYEDLFALSHPTAKGLHEMARKVLDEEWKRPVRRTVSWLFPSSREAIKPFDEISGRLERDAKREYATLQLMISDWSVPYPQSEKAERAIDKLKAAVEKAKSEAGISIVTFDLSHILGGAWGDLSKKGPKFNYLSPRNMDSSQIADLRQTFSTLIEKIRHSVTGNDRENNFCRVGFYLAYCELFDDAQLVLNDLMRNEVAKLELRVHLAHCFRKLLLRDDYERSMNELWESLQGFRSGQRNRLIRRTPQFVWEFSRGGRLDAAMRLSREASTILDPRILIVMSRSLFMQGFLSNISPECRQLFNYELPLSFWSYYKAGSNQVGRD